MIRSTVISLCAGKSERFDGKPKHLLEVDGKTLIARQRMQFGRVSVIDQSVVGETNATCETLLKSSHLWKPQMIVVLLGDVYYTDATATAIKQCFLPIAFWSDEQDIFAIKFHFVESKRITDGCKCVISGQVHNNGRLWELYRYLIGWINSDHLPDKERRFLQLVSDRTQDFDTPQEYDDFLKGRFKNKLLTKEA